MSMIAGVTLFLNQKNITNLSPCLFEKLDFIMSSFILRILFHKILFHIFIVLCFWIVILLNILMSRFSLFSSQTTTFFFPYIICFSVCFQTSCKLISVWDMFFILFSDHVFVFTVSVQFFFFFFVKTFITVLNLLICQEMIFPSISHI